MAEIFEKYSELMPEWANGRRLGQNCRIYYHLLIDRLIMYALCDTG